MIRAERLGDGVVSIEINRPEKNNAISIALWHALNEHFSRFADDPDVRVITLGSTLERTFCPGADISEFPRLMESENLRLEMQQAMQSACQSIANCPKVTVAVIDGLCIGAGCAIALACDLRVASNRARFAITPGKLGLIYSLADTFRLTAAVGRSQAKRLIFTGAQIDAAEALRIGLIDLCVTHAEVHACIAEFAILLSGCAMTTISGTKRILAKIDAGLIDDDEEALLAFRESFISDEAHVRIGDFLARMR